MRLFLFLILLSTSCFGQNTLLEKSFYKKFKVDSLIRGDWKLIETHANGKVIREEIHFGSFHVAGHSSWMKITKDSLFQFKASATSRSTMPPNEFQYELIIDPELTCFKLDIFQKEQKQLIRYNQFDFWFRNFDELVISSETRVDDGIGITPVKLIYVFKRLGESRFHELLTSKEWFYCPDKNAQFLQSTSKHPVTFYSDSTQKINGPVPPKCLNFNKESLYQTEWSLEKSSKTKSFTSFFGSEAKVFWDNHKMYFFHGKAILVYTIEELDSEKLVLKQDNESTIFVK